MPPDRDAVIAPGRVAHRHFTPGSWRDGGEEGDQDSPDVGVPILGLVENMSGLICPHCGKPVELFGPSRAQAVAAETGQAFGDDSSGPGSPAWVTAVRSKRAGRFSPRRFKTFRK